MLTLFYMHNGSCIGICISLYRCLASRSMASNGTYRGNGVSKCWRRASFLQIEKRNRRIMVLYHNISDVTLSVPKIWEFWYIIRWTFNSILILKTAANLDDSLLVNHYQIIQSNTILPTTCKNRAT